MDYLHVLPLQQLSRAFRLPERIQEDNLSEIIQFGDEETSPTVNLQLELDGFQCVLRIRDGPVIVVGVEVAGLKCDHVSCCISVRLSPLL